MDKKIKYKITWLILIILSFLLYFTGIVGFYGFFRKKILKRFRTFIILYHEISNNGIKTGYSVSKENFEKHISYVKHHYNVISLNDLIRNIGKKSDMLTDNIVITFDDGYKDNFLNAYPVLKKYNLNATIFLVSKLIGNKEEILNLDEIKVMEKDGIDFGSHTVTHKVLSDIDINTATKEINHSRIELENLLNRKIQYFAYPHGKKRHYNEYVKTQVKKAGYTAAFTTENSGIDTNSDLFELGRICIRNYPLFVFKVRVSGIFENKFIYSIRKYLI